MNAILASAHGSMCDTPGFRVFLTSRLRNAPHSRLVLFTGSMSAAARKACDGAEAEVVDCPANFADAGNKQRQWYFAKWLAEHAKEVDVVCTADARDTVVQADPFDHVVTPPGSPAVYFSSEGATVGEDEWNDKDSLRFNNLLRDQCRQSEDAWKAYQIINGGFVMGWAEAVAHFQLTRFALDARDGTGTDQSSLTALVNWIKDWPGYAVVGSDRPWVFHGHWYKTAVRKQQVRIDGEGTAFLGAAVEPYALFHQWDRCPAKDLVLKRYA